MNGPRVGIVGARRRRQGLGPFVARDLLACGAEVPCFVTTREQSRDETARALLEQHGVTARGYLSADAMLAGESLDAIAILSPAECHAEHLDAALDAGVHVLCEKPFVWGIEQLHATSLALVRRFDARGLLLVENCQWPYTLPAFRALHPNQPDTAPRRFEMSLQPTSQGLQRLGDALPHALSMLQALAPGGDAAIQAPAFESRGEDWLLAKFRYRAAGADVAVRVVLETSGRQPRAARFAIDGRVAQRLVDPRDYGLSLAADGRTVPLADPLSSLIADFVGALSSPSLPSSGTQLPGSASIAQRMALLEQLVAAYRANERATTGGERRE